MDLVGPNGSLTAVGNARNFSIRSETTKVVKNCLESAFVTEISRIKVPKEGNPRSVPFELIQLLSFQMK